MLAQLVEQRTFNPFVVGSTPAHPTKFILEIKHLQETGKCFFSARWADKNLFSAPWEPMWGLPVV